MTADREAWKQLRQAYEEAWRQRPASGDGDEVLTARLRAHGLHEALDDTTAIHQLVFELWRRQVPPTRLGREVWSLAGRAALQMFAVGREIWRAFQGGPEDEARQEELARLTDMPAGRRGVTETFREPPTAYLGFELSADSTALLRRYAALAPGLGGWARPAVWLAMLPDEPRAHVHLGSAVIGEAPVPATVWRRMRDAAAEGLYADGFLELRVRRDALETGTLLCSYVADPPGQTIGDWWDQG